MEAMRQSHCDSKLDRNRSFLQDMVLPLLVRIQTPANNEFESTFTSTQVSLPQYSSQQQDSYIQLGEVTVYLFTIRDERPRTVDIRHQNRFHCTKLCIPKHFARILMY